ncbi:MAG: DUF47 family protein [Candidatus Moduliflexus flocculans]|nr:DUF47 family protein [Candidatus Moduliflexus flocculans]
MIRPLLTLEGLDALKAYFASNDLASAQLLTTKEKEADEARRILIDELNRTFVTPFDREDIFALSRTIDDVLDYAYSTVNEMEHLQGGSHARTCSAWPPCCAMPPTNCSMAVDRLRAASRRGRRPCPARQGAREPRRRCLPRGPGRPVQAASTDLEHVVKMLKLREVYRHLSNAADRGDEAANVIADIVVKIA